MLGPASRTSRSTFGGSSYQTSGEAGVDLDMATILRQNLNPRSFRKLGVQHLSVDHGSLRFHTRVTP